jgi:2-polyprenyl-6-methoxyphenol hydroxylase-like FAD-dependent oxidoreductase
MDVLVIGAGIGGPGVALGLARAGHAVRIFEQEDPYAAAGSGLVLSPNGVRALDHLDPVVGQRVREEAVRATEPFPYLSPAGRVKVNVPSEDIEAKWGAPLVPIRRRHLRRLLVNALPRSTLRARRRLVAVDENSDDVVAKFADGSTARGDLLIGADGVWSVVRYISANAEPRYLGMTSVRGVAPAPVQPFPAGFCTQGPGLQFFAARLRDGLVYWAATINAPEHDWPRLPVETARSSLAELVHDWHSPVPELIAETPADELVVTDIHDMDPLQHWSTGRVTLVGDSAHPMAPFLGQGANVALEDAATLCRTLGETTDIGAALQAYEAARVGRTTRLATISRRIGVLGQSEHRLGMAVRDIAMRVLMRFGGGSGDSWLYGYEP